MGIKIGIIGALGKMGTMLVKQVCAESDIELSGAVEYEGHSDEGMLLSDLIPGLETEVSLTTQVETILGGTDVLIDFSLPDSLEHSLPLIQRAGVPLVLGTTGLSVDLERKLIQASEDIAILASPNMSLGVNLMFEVVDIMARVLRQDYDIEIVEKHHNRKQDAPSGTAVRLLSVVKKALELNDEQLVYGREGQVGSRPRGQVGVHAVRGGTYIGEHDVIFAGEGESLTVTHQAQSRNVFVLGAIQAARFLHGKVEGRYTMRDVLGLSSFQD